VVLAAAIVGGMARPGLGLAKFVSNWDGAWYLAVAAHGFTAWTACGPGRS
jgi:hypothetical protein